MAVTAFFFSFFFLLNIRSVLFLPDVMFTISFFLRLPDQSFRGIGGRNRKIFLVLGFVDGLFFQDWDP